MLTPVVLICSLTVTPDLRDCSRDNATNVVQIPEEFLLPAQCMMRGQAYLAETTIGQELTMEERVKVMCVRQMIVGRRVI